MLSRAGRKKMPAPPLEPPSGLTPAQRAAAAAVAAAAPLPVSTVMNAAVPAAATVVVTAVAPVETAVSAAAAAAAAGGGSAAAAGGGSAAAAGGGSAAAAATAAAPPSVLHKYIEEWRKGLRSEVLYDGVVDAGIPPGAKHPFEHIGTETQLKHVAGHYDASGLVPASSELKDKLEGFIDAMRSSDVDRHGGRGLLPELGREQQLGQGKCHVYWSARYACDGLRKSDILSANDVFVTIKFLTTALRERAATVVEHTVNAKYYSSATDEDEIELAEKTQDPLALVELIIVNDLLARAKAVGVEEEAIRTTESRKLEAMDGPEDSDDHSFKEAQVLAGLATVLVDLIKEQHYFDIEADESVAESDEHELDKMKAAEEDRHLADLRTAVQKYAPIVAKTSILHGAGETPVWNEGFGEILVWGKDVDTSTKCIIDAWDWDRYEDADRLGRAVVSLADVDGGKNSFSRWFELSRYGLGQHPCGRIHLHIDYNLVDDDLEDEEEEDTNNWRMLQQVSLQAPNYTEELTLKVEQELDLSSKGFAHTDLPLVCAWLLRCELEAKASNDPDKCVQSVNLADNPTAVGSMVRKSLGADDADTVHIEAPPGVQPTAAARDVATYDPVAAYMPSSFGMHYPGEAQEMLEDFVFGTEVETDQHLPEFKLLCHCLQLTSVHTLSLSGIGMGPAALKTFALLLPSKLADVTVDSVRLVVDRELDLKKSSFSKQYVPLLREWLRKPDVLAVLESIDLDQNENLCGGVDEDGGVVPDAEVGTFKLVCDAIKGTKLKRLCVRNTGMGPESAAVLGSLVSQMSFLVVNASATGNHSGIARNDDPEISIKDVMEMLQDSNRFSELAAALMRLPSLIIVFQARGIHVEHAKLVPSLRSVFEMKNLQEEMLKSIQMDETDDEQDEDDGIDAHLKFKPERPLPQPEELEEEDREIYLMLQEQIDALKSEKPITLEEAARFAMKVMERPAVLHMFERRGFGAEKATISPDPTEEQVTILTEDLMGSGDPNNYTLECWTELSTRMIDLSGRHFSAGDAEVLAAWFGMPQLRSLETITLSSSGSKVEDYTLDDFSHETQLSAEALGEADVIIQAAWLKHPLVAANLNLGLARPVEKPPTPVDQGMSEYSEDPWYWYAISRTPQMRKLFRRTHEHLQNHDLEPSHRKTFRNTVHKLQNLHFLVHKEPEVEEVKLSELQQFMLEQKKQRELESEPELGLELGLEPEPELELQPEPELELQQQVLQQQVPLQPAAPTFASVAPAAAVATSTFTPAPLAAPAATGSNVRELRAQAVAAGVPPDAIEEARDADDPKAALIALIVAATLVASQAPMPVGSTAAEQEAELQACGVPELRKKAAKAGCDDDAIEEARNTDDPKAALIALIVAATLEREPGPE
eukprot:COSAG06_NODE_1537_length_9151_cov_2.179187_3_plen_1388_part_00